MPVARLWRMPFGKHKGKTLENVPPDYLDWAMKQTECRPQFVIFQAKISEYREWFAARCRKCPLFLAATQESSVRYNESLGKLAVRQHPPIKIVRRPPRRIFTLDED